jgi:hypothetical protein
MTVWVRNFTLAAICCLAAPGQAQVSDFRSTDFKKADSIAERYAGHSLLDLPSLSANLTSSLNTDEEKFWSIYKWVCTNIENDYNLFAENKRMRENITDTAALRKWNAEFGIRAMQRLMNERRTVCTGYAALLQALSRYAGIECEIVDGYGRTMRANVEGPGKLNHSWNAVRLRNKWFLCDPTWSSGAFDVETGTFIKRFNDAYFLPDVNLFVRNHYSANASWMLMDEKPTLKEFLDGPLIYSGAFKYDVTIVSPSSLKLTVKKGQRLSFQLTSRGITETDKIVLLINKTNARKAVASCIEHHGKVDCTIQYTFKTKGTYPVHITINNEHVVTYYAVVQ